MDGGAPKGELLLRPSLPLCNGGKVRTTELLITLAKLLDGGGVVVINGSSELIQLMFNWWRVLHVDVCEDAGYGGQESESCD